MLDPILISFNKGVKKLPLIIILFGVFLMALSGLEKIIIYLNFAEQSVRSMDTLLSLVPDYIWSITNYTFIGGLFMIALALLIIYKNKYAPRNK